ncbi:hypothetical protein [Gracilibacillus alcaliphilus]|uniref:hypothetical protein n=1 Tax=Gracilibacillus alcaliphilus TaxID=1401441 RepID=UPI00195E826A|nr:hypothetical protein [Gracilibacillus alcaliphilus]MBM7677111.1 ABC-type bacteriocin/lantibiotic exporter with double-glycine peptidase domain [Gracilibacillus alcaliphilus]
MPKDPYLVKDNVPQLSVQINFRHVSFAYEGDNQVLHDINLYIEPNQRIAIIGESGSGKRNCY